MGLDLALKDGVLCESLAIVCQCRRCVLRSRTAPLGPKPMHIEEDHSERPPHARSCRGLVASNRALAVQLQVGVTPISLSRASPAHRAQPLMAPSLPVPY